MSELPRFISMARRLGPPAPLPTPQAPPAPFRESSQGSAVLGRFSRLVSPLRASRTLELA